MPSRAAWRASVEHLKVAPRGESADDLGPLRFGVGRRDGRGGETRRAQVFVVRSPSRPRREHDAHAVCGRAARDVRGGEADDG